VGTFTLTLTATDSQNAATSKTITVRVVNANRAPTANAQRVVANEDTPIQFTLTGSDPDQDALKLLSFTRPTNGLLTGTFPTLTYTPNANFNGTDSFTFRVTDGQLDSAPATVTLVVNPVNDAPVLNVPGVQNVTVGQALNFTVSATDTDSAQTLTFSATNLPAGATFNAATRQFSWTPSVNQVGTFTITFTVIDNGTPPRSDAKSVTINVSGGAGWQQTGGPTGGGIRALAVSGTAIIAASLQGVLFRSTNGGASWTEVANSGNFEAFWAVTATGSRVYAVTSSRVLVSNDNGATWTNNAATYPSGVVTSLVANGNTVLLALIAQPATSGVYRSTDGGTTWTFSNTGITSTFVTALSLSGSVALAGGASGGIFRSTDSGANWAAVAGQQQTIIESFAATGTTFFAANSNGAILRSTDNGATFGNFSVIEGAATALFLDSGNLYASTAQIGIFRIDSAGATTFLGSTGLEGEEINALVVNGGALTAASLFNGIFRSTNNGQSFSPSNTGLIATTVLSLASGGGFVFAGMVTSVQSASGSLARTNNGGTTWTNLSLPQADEAVTALAYGNNVLIAGWPNAGLFRSTDNGTTFTTVATTIGLTDTRALLANGATMFCGTANGIFRSTDSGANWARVYTASGPVISLSLIGTTIYAGVGAQTAGTLFRSTDNGANWASANLAQAVTSVVQTGSTLLASVIPNNNVPIGIYRSTDSGATWTAASSGLPTPFAFKLVAVGTAVYAATGGGVYVSTNAGQTWTAFNDGLRNLFTDTLLANGTTLFAGTIGSGVWARALAP
ncbi:MAG: cadherin-like domain-containing protein, partial [Acidobacteria bacterium]|nr:cadherin-like domain-containing protein [Acidobacteriota bacterium]